MNDLSKPVMQKMLGPTLKAKPYPHTKNFLYTLDAKGSVLAYDTNSADLAPVFILSKGQVLDFDHNPNKLHTLATGSKNSALEFWDTRKPNDGPISVLLGHTHWVASVEYNHYYDQLVITGSTSTEIFLWKAIAQSSQVGNKSGVVSVYSEEEDKRTILTQLELDDSVYVTKWSQQEPWIYAALGYSGQLLVAHVPYGEKYKIMI